jgi:hypothetical protein
MQVGPVAAASQMGSESGQDHSFIEEMLLFLDHIFLCDGGSGDFSF